MKDALKQGQHLIAVENAEHVDAPPVTGWNSLQREKVVSCGIIIEPNQDWEGATGSKLTEVRVMELSGKMPDFAIKMMSQKMPPGSLEAWQKAIDKVING